MPATAKLNNAKVILDYHYKNVLHFALEKNGYTIEVRK